MNILMKTEKDYNLISIDAIFIDEADSYDRAIKHDLLCRELDKGLSYE